MGNSTIEKRHGKTLASILVVDDEPSIRKLVGRSLQPNGHTLLFAEDGDQALKIIDREEVDLVITDIRMPGVNGMELTRISTEKFNCEVIAMTGLWEQYRYEDLISLGAADYLRKPFSPEEVVLRVNRVIAERQRREEIYRLQNQASMFQRIESLGQVSSGILHEIRTPLQYAGDNISFINTEMDRINGLMDTLVKTMEPLRTGSADKIDPAELNPLLADTDLEYLRRELPAAAEQALNGISQIKTIIRTMRRFTQPGEISHSPVDINQCIRDAATVSKGEWKHVAALDLDLDESISMAMGHQGELVQVFLNLIINAAHAVSERSDQTGAKKGSIIIRTGMADEGIEIRISDTGTGIPGEVLSRIFDPFFTTKSGEKGSGQGLAIVRSIVEDRHHGTIKATSLKEHGAAFTICLPV